MDLTKMFINTYTGGAEVNLKASSANVTSKGSSNDFESYLNKADSKNIATKQTNRDNNEVKRVNEKDNSNNNSEQKIDSSKNKDVKELDKNKSNVEKQDSKTKVNEVKTEDTKDSTKIEDEKVIDADVAKEINQEIVNLIAQKTGLSVEEINAVLESLNMQAVELNDANNLLSFMMALTEVDTPIDLISVNGVKEIMQEIKSVFEESDKFVKFAEDMAKLANAEENVQVEQADVKSDVVANDETELNSMATTVDENSQAINVAESEEIEVTVDLSKATEKTETKNSKEVVEENTSAQLKQQAVASASENAGSNNGSQFQDKSSLLNSKSSEVNVAGVVMDNITKAFNEAVIRTESTKHVDTAEVVKQIVDKIKVGINKDVTELKISLKPEELGDVTVKIASQNGIITAQITAESQRVKEIIEAGFNQLKQALSDAGVEVSQLEVNVGSSDQNNDFGNQTASNEKSSARINQIIDEVEEEEKVSYVKENEVVGANVNYTA